MKTRWVPISFTFLYVLAMLKPVMPVFDYVINQDYIAEYLCINKDKPAMDCNGKCYLMEMLEAENQQKKQNIPAIDLREYPIGFVNVLHIPALTHISIKPTINAFYSQHYNFLFNHTLFQPPVSL
ncbi:hypothetical protein [Galbibacter sp.]|uniref:hypothetical protein n=1 Tax=Galbibacter sp. TaxID=2918471 RepID=UPI002B5FBB98|nr:hypothetical protein [Galbibacter sp.]HLV63047.1 hypothetical protein [Galbibacter sp.]